MFLALRAMLRDPESQVLAGAAAAVVAVGSVVYMLLEGWTPIQAAYFCVVTLATVGFGDLHPTTELAQLFTIFYIIVGIGIIGGFITQLARHGLASGRLGSMVQRVEERSETRTPAGETGPGRDELPPTDPGRPDSRGRA